MRSMHFHHNHFMSKLAHSVICLIVILCSPVIHAEQSDQSKGTGSDIVYDQVYFNNYQPVTLKDMIRVVPGGLNILSNLGQGKQSRGLGSAGDQILIDGKRMSGKTNDMSARLSRIQASQVERIELIRGTAEGLDVRSNGTLLNVILKTEAATDYYAEVMTQYNDVTGQIPELLLTKNGAMNNLDYTVSYHYDTWLRYQDEFEDRQEPELLIREFRDLGKESEITRHTFTSNGKYNLPSGDIIQLNAFYRDERRLTENLESQRDAVSDALLATEEQVLDYNQTRWEFGADYETDLGNLGNLKSLLILSRTANLDSIVQDEIVTDVSERLFTFVEDVVQTERIVRLNLSENVLESHTIELGGEAAYNQLMANQSFDFADFEQSVVSEDRFEVFVTYTIPLNQQVNLQLAMNREKSTIEQDSIGIENTRQYEFWKPRLELRYDLDEHNQFRVLTEKSASQLNLRNFVAKRNTEDDTIDLGNPFLRPETIQRTLVGFEHRFAQDTGTVKLEVFQEDIQDHISQAPLLDGGTGIGNIGDAESSGFNLESNFKLDSLGLDEALLSFSYEYRDTQANDPFLGEFRPLNSVPMHSYFLDYRHDLAELGLVYGLSAHKRTSMFRSDITLFEVRRNDIHVSNIFLEYTLAPGTRLRAEIRNPLNDTKRYDKTFYVDNIANQMIDRIELRETKVRPTFALKLQVSF